MPVLKIVLATTNKGKAAEMQAILAPFLPACALVLSLADWAGPFSPAWETGGSFAQIAQDKASHYAEQLGCLCVADDSGLCVDALGGAPGIYSSRWAGEEATDADRIGKLLGALEDAGAVEEKDRQARFICAAAAAAPGGWEAWAEGTCEGIITRQRRGAGGFGYDPVFLIPDLGVTLAEIGPEQKNRLSHRAKALWSLALRMQSYLSGSPIEPGQFK